MDTGENTNQSGEEVERSTNQSEEEVEESSDQSAAAEESTSKNNQSEGEESTSWEESVTHSRKSSKSPGRKRKSVPLSQETDTSEDE